MENTLACCYEEETVQLTLTIKGLDHPWRYDIRHNDIQYNDTQHNGLNSNPQHK